MFCTHLLSITGIDHMAFEKLSFRLGMHHGLYIGICIGVLLTAFIILIECSILKGGITHILATVLALIGAAFLVIGFIYMMENKEFRSSDLTCTCRYRSSLYTLCKHCALSESIPEKDTEPGDQKE